MINKIDKYIKIANDIAGQRKRANINEDESKSRFWFRLDKDDSLPTNEKVKLYRYLSDKLKQTK